MNARRDPRQKPDEPDDGQGEPKQNAETPSELSARGWKKVLRKLGKEVGSDQLSLVAAALAFYGTLSLFPALTTLVAIYGLIFDPHDIWEQSAKLSSVLPGDVHGLVIDQLSALVESDGLELGLGLLSSLVLLLWSASTGVHHLIRAVNVAYGESEERTYFRLRSLALGLTVGIILFVAFSIALIAIIPKLLFLFGYAGIGQKLINIFRWPLLTLGIVVALAVLYRYGPDRRQARWRWVSWGAAVATIIWLAGSGLFAWYVETFGSYNETYGALGAVVVFQLWLYISAFAILIGAELNALMERRTSADSTDGPDRPPGQRGAAAADAVPEEEDGPAAGEDAGDEDSDEDEPALELGGRTSPSTP